MQPNTERSHSSAEASASTTMSIKLNEFSEGSKPQKGKRLSKGQKKDLISRKTWTP